MAKASDLMDSWNNIKEIDLRPLQQQALNGVRVAIVGKPGSGRSTLAGQMRRDPARPQQEADTPLWVLALDSAEQAANADLIILVMDGRDIHLEVEQALVQGWANAGKRVLIVVNEFIPSVEDTQPLAAPQLTAPPEQPVVVVETGAAAEPAPSKPEEKNAIVPRSATGAALMANWRKRRMVRGPIIDTDFLVSKFAPAVIELLPDQLLGLGRYFPLFRVPVAHHLINDTCLSNAAYSLSTGLAEIIPVFDVPLNMADMFVLTKTQAYLVYKLGLALGFSTRWQDYVAEFGSVLGTGFLWRQLARGLVGLIPVWGIVPKVAVAYSGTYVVGNAILQWYLTGRHISPKQMRALYTQAFERGRAVARTLVEKAPKPKLPKISRPRLPERKQRALPAPKKKANTCPECGKTSAKDAAFCQYCGKAFEKAEAEEKPA